MPTVLLRMVPRMVPTALRTLLLWLLPRVITTLLLTVLPRRCQPCCEASANYAANRKKLASMVALLACRGGVRTFVAACGWRTSLACFVGTLAAVPGCNGDAGASPDCFPGRVSSLAVLISGWPRILPVRLESSFLRWQCAVRVNGMANFLSVAAGHRL